MEKAVDMGGRYTAGGGVVTARGVILRGSVNACPSGRCRLGVVRFRLRIFGFRLRIFRFRLRIFGRGWVVGRLRFVGITRRGAGLGYGVRVFRSIPVKSLLIRTSQTEHTAQKKSH